MRPGLLLVAATVVIPLLGGCSGGDTVPAHSPEEQKAIERDKNLTPQERIEGIKKSPMPDSAKEAMIREIKTKNGLK